MAKRRKNAGSAITMADVARQAGVSVVTVSRVLNDHEYVSEETKLHVTEIIQRLGYKPNAMARSLVSHQTKSVGLVTTDLSDFFFAQTISGAESEASREDYFCLLGSTEGVADKEPQYIRLFQERHIDGLFFVRPSTDIFDNRTLALLAGELPIVTVSYHLPLDNVYVVDVDNVSGGRQATEHLIELGHRRIAMITGPQEYRSVRDRILGFEMAMQAANIPIDESLIIESSWHYQGGYHAMQRLLERGLNFTALFAQSDEIAIGVFGALRDAGFQSPDDISIVGYNNNPVTEYLNPSLTTIDQPMRQIGELGMRLLIEAIRGGHPAKEHLLSPSLIIRGSTRAI
jgi:DNA-binding LacI/PurR family transcriptional regulator